jgi:hypothetical protein
VGIHSNKTFSQGVGFLAKPRKIYGDTLPWSLWYRLRLQEPQESVPLYLVLLTHEARLHILSNVVSHARPVVPPLLQGLVVHIDYFVPNLIANAETSVQNVPWKVLLFQLWCNCALSVTTSYFTVGDRIGAMLLGGRKQRAKSLKPVQEKERYSVLQ